MFDTNDQLTSLMPSVPVQSSPPELNTVLQLPSSLHLSALSRLSNKPAAAYTQHGCHARRCCLLAGAVE
jgi:hypothetical protein